MTSDSIPCLFTKILYFLEKFPLTPNLEEETQAVCISPEPGTRPDPTTRGPAPGGGPTCVPSPGRRLTRGHPNTRGRCRSQGRGTAPRPRSPRRRAQRPPGQGVAATTSRPRLQAHAEGAATQGRRRTCQESGPLWTLPAPGGPAAPLLPDPDPDPGSGPRAPAPSWGGRGRGGERRPNPPPAASRGRAPERPGLPAGRRGVCTLGIRRWAR